MDRAAVVKADAICLGECHCRIEKKIQTNESLELGALSNKYSFLRPCSNDFPLYVTSLRLDSSNISQEKLIK